MDNDVTAKDHPGTTNPLLALANEGQAVWLDYIQRNILASGELARMIRDDGLRGVTSNPAIFEKAMAGSGDYTVEMATLAGKGLDAKAIYEQLAIADIRDAADVLATVYEQTRTRDGYVSLEVSPALAQDTQGTSDEARRLWGEIGRPNVMIKVPATPAGISAFETLIAEGINVNVTLLFSLSAYELVAHAYLRGLERRAASGEALGNVASVASFFISRIDSAIDAMVDAQLKRDGDNASLRSLRGRVAIANARLTYARYVELFSGPRWDVLAKLGAQTQRVLWASTGTKNPEYRDTLYVESLIGVDTVNTIPPATYAAFRQHGRVRASLAEGVDASRAVMTELDRAGISMRVVTDRLLAEGLKLFADAFDKLLGSIGANIATHATARASRPHYRLPEKLAKRVAATLATWQPKVRQLWGRDASLWTGGDEPNWLGWLCIVDEEQGMLDSLQAFASEVKAAGFRHALLLGMGGSSLAPEVLQATFAHVPDFPLLHVLDSTDPEQLLAYEGKLDLARTLFIVASKSGSTLEPNILKEYFFARLEQLLGPAEAGRCFIAITDPGSNLEKVATAAGFRRIFYGHPSIGGRYSALSQFGMVPAAVMGLDVGHLLARTKQMIERCKPEVPVEENPAVPLGVVLGEAARAGCDKLTLIMSQPLRSLGAWLEQLVAESTGKAGQGIIPVDREPVGESSAYGADRLFVYMRLATALDDSLDYSVEALENAGHAVVRIDVASIDDLGQEMFRWEFATAVAGAVLGIHPFDQPDVEASKIATKVLTNQYESNGALPGEQPFFAAGGLQLYANDDNVQALHDAAAGEVTLAGLLRAHLSRVAKGDYFALLAYIEMNAANDEALQSMRLLVRDARRIATCVGFGPRFLHSTGQAYKGGPNSGVFLQITSDAVRDVAVPGHRYTFGIVKAAQARGDLAVLAERGRRVVRVHLASDVKAGLLSLETALKLAIA
ncbi:MAG: bifunctional transaldolase/phosoglucose isomerase [Betaproteobacteria bacterium]|nr:bifunctional transaldolase/phosoglucose isomerase [Betaproteobacteria bacterium]